MTSEKGGMGEAKKAFLITREVWLGLVVRREEKVNCRTGFEREKTRIFYGKRWPSRSHMCWTR